MKYLNFIYLFALLSFIGCGGGREKDSIFKLSNEAIPVYNHAYQENFKADNIEQIVSDAKNAYVLLDTFDQVTNEDISNIKVNHNQVGGYISAGTGENYGDDFPALEPYLTPTAWPEWPDEFFVSETTTGILPLMKKRIDIMASLGVDWVEFDNMDWLDEDSRIQYNLTATVKEAKIYINALCDYTKTKGMKCMAKNTIEGYESFDGVLYESFSNEKNWWDNEGTKLFLNAGKLVIINHYNETDCDSVYAEYKMFYNSDDISFICEDKNLKIYRHYNEE